MNDMATVEYLLKAYAKNYDASENSDSLHNRNSYFDKAEMAHEIINERFGMGILMTDTEYIAYNNVCSIRVKRHRQGE